jgi:hypothetical protein
MAEHNEPFKKEGGSCLDHSRELLASVQAWPETSAWWSPPHPLSLISMLVFKLFLAISRHHCRIRVGIQTRHPEACLLFLGAILQPPSEH